MKLYDACVTEFKKVIFHADDLSCFDIKKLILMNGEGNIANIKSYTICNNKVELELKDNINIKNECYISYENITKKVIYTDIFNSKEFNKIYYHDGPLGILYSKEYTIFKLWSPAASSVKLLLYMSSEPYENEKSIKHEMKEIDGVWYVLIRQNLKNMYYTFEVEVYNRINEAVDPYAKALGINGHRGYITDLLETNPRGFKNDNSPVINNFTDAILYETSIRDISIHPDSGVVNKGKFIGLCEENTFSSKGISTALNHIKELGVTHVQIMPFFDFSFHSVDEKNPQNYNWGYDPQNYNAPEGSYSTNPYEPNCRIYELKELIQTLHKNGLCVNMDVVYNHYAGEENNNFEKIFPGYYFRFNNDGSFVKGTGCENDTASERLMFRKFMIDSMIYWATEYHIDGFRVDLMGIHDVETMNLIRESLNNISSKIMLYGEGWNLGTKLPEEDKAIISNAYKMPHIGHFNDMIRDTLKGSVFNAWDTGFVSGKQYLEQQIKKCVTASINFNNYGLFQTPDQSINYVSAHDNNTLWDKLEISNGGSGFEELKKMHKLANSIVLTSQGIPFLCSGEEFCRTKNKIENSYKSPDYINRLDWERKAHFLDTFAYYKGLIKLRKEHPAFRMNDTEYLASHIEFICNTPRNVVAYILKDYANGDSWKDIIVIYNANTYPVKIHVPFGTWKQVTDVYVSGTEIIRTVTDFHLEASGISTCVYYKNN
ncbi:MAG: type I pullulanase [Bacillota bacterium]|nr:type I pullulanase [Bacillota bacterium]